MAYNFPPMGGGGVQRSGKFVKFLPQFGWVPTVVAADDPYYWARDDTLLDDIAPEIVVKRLPPMRPHALHYFLSKITSDTVSRRLLDNVFIPDDRILWALRATLCARTMIRKHAIRAIYTTSPPHSTHISGLILKRMTGLPWVADFRDLWTGDFRYDPPTRWVRNAHTYCERKILEEADRVICISETARRMALSHFRVDPERLVTIYNGFDPGDLRKKTTVPSKESIVMTHSGSLYGRHVPWEFFHALATAVLRERRLGERLIVRFVGVMDTAVKHAISQILGGLAVFDGYVDHSKAIDAIMTSDINLIALPLNYGLPYMVTGKIFEYLAAGSPVLAVVPPGEAADIITSARVGIVLHGENPERLPEQIVEAIALLTEGRGFSPDKRVISRFERKHLTGQLARVFNDVIGE